MLDVCLRSLCCCCSCMRHVRRRVATQSIMYLLPLYTCTHKKKIALVMRGCFPETRWSKGQRFLPFGDFPYREITIRDVNNLNLQSPMPDVPISDACVDLGLLPSEPSFPRTPVQLHLYSTNPCGPRQPRHLLLSCDRESRDHGFTGRNSFASQNPECRIPTSRDLVPPILVTSTALIKSGNRRS
jgi:hypothetical protein